GQRPGPAGAQILDVVLVDLIERAIAPAVVGPPPHQPVRWRRAAQHRIADRRQRGKGIGFRRLRLRCRRGEQNQRQAEQRRSHGRGHSFLPKIARTRRSDVLDGTRFCGSVATGVSGGKTLTAEWKRRLYAAFFSRSFFHWPSAARPFISARWA